MQRRAERRDARQSAQTSCLMARPGAQVSSVMEFVFLQKGVSSFITDATEVPPDGGRPAHRLTARHLGYLI